MVDIGDPAGGLLGPEPAVRALGCLLEYGPTPSVELPDDISDLVAGALAARAGDEAVATAVGMHLPALDRHAGEFTATLRAVHPSTPVGRRCAAARLRWAGYDRCC
ncbi:hypothetical protein AB0M05_35220 [Streptomyces violaceusniger]|uniref:hypothetical protein n=1 Tax=Streptomyces violaceusniger TaxID=68280 RepID=UPI0034380900